MSENGFYLLPTNKLYKKEDTRQLKNFPAGYVGSFYKNMADNINIRSDFYSRITADAKFQEKMSKSISWQHLTFQKVFRRTLITMSSKMQVLGKN